MPEQRRYHDTIVLGGSSVNKFLFLNLNEIARTTLAIKYPHSTMIGVDWTFATTPEQVDAWPLPHDCDSCQEGKTNAIVALTAGTVKVIALGNMTCEEPVDA